MQCPPLFGEHPPDCRNANTLVVAPPLWAPSTTLTGRRCGRLWDTRQRSTVRGVGRVVVCEARFDARVGRVVDCAYGV